MRTKILFLVAMLFLAIAIFSCKKDVKTINVDTELEKLSFCPGESNNFSLGSNSGYIQFNISNFGQNENYYQPVMKAYNNGKLMLSYYSTEQKISGFSSISYKSPHKINYPYPRVFSITVRNAETIPSCVGLGYFISNFKYFQRVGYWEITGEIENGPGDYPDTEVLITAKQGNSTKLLTSFKPTQKGVHPYLKCTFKVIIENDAVNGANYFTWGFNDYPNKKGA